MSDWEDLQQRITPYWSESELNEVLYPTGNLIDSDKKIQRDNLKQAIEDQYDDTEDILSTVSAVVQWDNKEAAIALWAGQIKVAEELRSDDEMYNSPEAVEIALIERFAQPVYEERGVTEPQIVDKMFLVVQSSPISDLRPHVWRDEKYARDWIREILDEYVDRKQWGEN